MTSDELRDLANKRQALRIRIHEDEQRLAMAYAGEEERLTQNLEHHRALLSTLDKRLGEAKDEARRQVRESIEAFFGARDVLVKLNGHFQDPGFTDQAFTRPYMSRGPVTPWDTNGGPVVGDPLTAHELKAVLLRVTDMGEAREPEVPEHQLMHAERVRNERAGLGHYTDAELLRLKENPLVFHHGAGARVVQRQDR